MTFDPSTITDANQQVLTRKTGESPASALSNQVVQVIPPATCDVYSDLQPADPSDDFTGTDSDAPKKNLWIDGTINSGYTIDIQSNKLTGTNDGTSAYANNYIESRFRISGDFDIQADCDTTGQTVLDTYWSVYFDVTKVDDDSNYRVFVGQDPNTSTETRRYTSNLLDAGTWAGAQTSNTTDIAGKVRVVRSGAVLTGYYWNGSGWTQLITESTWTTGDVLIRFYFRPRANDTSVYTFDNFTINSGTVIWPDSPKQLAILDSSDDQCPVEIDLWERGPEPVNHWTTDVTTLTAAEASDDFAGDDSDPPDTHKWNTEEANGTIQIDSNALKFAVSSNTVDDRVTSAFKLSGDFDTQCDFSDLVNISANFSCIRLVATESLDSYDDMLFVDRGYDGTGNVYDSSIRTGGANDDTDVVATTDASGKLRLVRSGTTVTGYYWNGSGWTSMSTYASWATNDVYIAIRFYSNVSGTRSAKVDNFTINSADSIEMLVDENAALGGTITNMTQTSGGPFEKYLAGGDVSSVVKNVDFGASSVSFKALSFWHIRTNTSKDTHLLLTNNGEIFFIQRSTNGNYLCLYNGSSSNNTNLTITETTDWHHIMLVEGASNNSHWVWVDGVKASAAQSSNFAGIFRYIGRIATSGTQEAPHITNIQVFDFIPTDAQIAMLYAAGARGNQYVANHAVLNTLLPSVPTSAPSGGDARLVWDSTQDDNDFETIEATATFDDCTGTNDDPPNPRLWTVSIDAGGTEAFAKITDNELHIKRSQTDSTYRGLKVAHRFEIIPNASGIWEVSVDYEKVTATATGLYIDPLRLSGNGQTGQVRMDYTQFLIDTSSTSSEINGTNPTSGTIWLRYDFTLNRMYGWFQNGGGSKTQIGSYHSVDFGAASDIDFHTRCVAQVNGTSEWKLDNFQVTIGSVKVATRMVGDSGSIQAEQVYPSAYNSRWGFNQDPSGTAPQLLDSTGTYDGTSAGSMTASDLIDGLIGKGWNFDNTDDKATLSSNLGITGFPIVLGCKFKVSSGGGGPIIGDDASGNYTGIRLSCNDSGMMSIRYGDGAGLGSSNRKDYLTAASSFSLDSEVTVFLYVPSFDNHVLYINGSAVTLTYDSGTATSCDLTNTSWEVGGAASYFGGDIYEAFVGTITLSADYAAFLDASLTDTLFDWSDYSSAPTNPYEIDLTIAAQSETLTDFPVTVPLQASSGLTSFDTSQVFNYLGPLGKAECADVEPTSHWTTDTTSLTLAEASDDFTGTDGDAPDPLKWVLTPLGEINSNRLKLTANSSYTIAQVSSLFSLSGDFDIQVSVDISTAPSTNRWDVYLKCTNSSFSYTVDRQYNAGSNLIFGQNTIDYTKYQTTSSDNTVDFRLVRSSGSYTYYWRSTGAGSWNNLGTDTRTNTDDVTVQLTILVRDSLPTVIAEYFDFTINSADSIIMLVDEKQSVSGTITNMTQTSGGPFDNYLAGGSVSATVRNVDFGAGSISFKSISFWVKRVTTTDESNLCMNSATNRKFAIRASANGNYLAAYNGSWVNSNLVVSDATTWHHVIIVEGTSSNAHWYYLDGVKASAEITTNMAGAFRYLGRATTTSAQEVPDITNIQIFDSVLTDAQVRNLYLVDKDRFATNMLHDNTVLYIESNDTDGATEFFDLSDSAHAVTRSGDTHHDTGASKYSKSAIYFDGTDDSLSVVSHTDFDFGSGDFTIRGWFYVTEDAYGTLVGKRAGTGSYTPFLVYYEPTGNILTAQASTSGSSWVTQTSSALSLNFWYHFEVVRSGSNFYLFVNGSSVGAAQTITGSVISNSDPVRIGDDADGAIDFKGYIQGLQIIKGTALHTSDFTPPICLSSAPDYRKLEFWNELKTQKLYGEIELWETWDNTALRGLAHTKATLGTSETVLKLNHNPANADNSAYVDMTTSAAAQSVWRSAIKSRWGFSQDPSISKLLDSTSNALHCTTYNMDSTNLVNSDVGKALSFATDEYASISDDSRLDVDGTSDFTFIALIKGDNDVSGIIFQKKNAHTSTPAAGYSLYYRATSPYMYFNLSDGTNSTSAVDSFPTNMDNQLSMVGWQLDFTNNLGRAYLDGTFVDDGSISVLSSLANSNSFEIGRNYNGGSPANFLTAEISELRVINEAISAAEIATTNNTLIDNLITFSQAIVITPDGEEIVVGYHKPLSMFSGFPTRYANKQLFPGFKLNSRYLLPKYSTFFGYLLWLIHTGQAR